MKIYFIVGEPSGDLLASGLMKALLKVDPSIEFRGMGGESMIAKGFCSLFNIAEISVMGFFEVLPRLPLILKRLKQTIADIEKWQPDVIVTVDSWGFASSLLSRLKKRKSKIPTIHYVAPQVWAWKKSRAKKVAQLTDHLMTLLPNECQYFEKYGLHCEFVGHPVAERIAASIGTEAIFRDKIKIPANAKVICVLPGSRRSEIRKLAPVFKRAIIKINECEGDFHVVIPTVVAMETKVRKIFSDLKLPVRIVTGTENRYNTFKISDIAIAASGTVSLELAALKVPHLIAYTFNTLTNIMVKMTIKIRFANLINILANREIIPEFVLNNCRPYLIANCAISLLNSRQKAESQVLNAQQTMQQLNLPNIMPSERAAQIVIETVKN